MRGGGNNSGAVDQVDLSGERDVLPDLLEIEIGEEWGFVVEERKERTWSSRVSGLPCILSRSLAS